MKSSSSMSSEIGVTSSSRTSLTRMSARMRRSVPGRSSSPRMASSQWYSEYRSKRRETSSAMTETIISGRITS